MHRAVSAVCLREGVADWEPGPTAAVQCHERVSYGVSLAQEKVRMQSTDVECFHTTVKPENPNLNRFKSWRLCFP